MYILKKVFQQSRPLNIWKELQQGKKNFKCHGALKKWQTKQVKSLNAESSLSVYLVYFKNLYQYLTVLYTKSFKVQTEQISAKNWISAKFHIGTSKNNTEGMRAEKKNTGKTAAKHLLIQSPGCSVKSYSTPLDLLSLRLSSSSLH